MRELIFSKAEIRHTECLVELINSAYRGEPSKLGWTTEADLLDGRRTDAKEIRDLLADEDSMIMLCQSGADLLGSVHLQKTGERVQIGMLAVSPPLQGRGIGKQLLQAAELAAQEAWAVNRFVMSVIPQRRELIAFYERRGYRRTGVSKAFPENPELWAPKVDGLRLELLEKVLRLDVSKIGP
ncbi:MAG: GNAT family N-acetyltransferase [Methylococcaceae bacterium]|nr:GNAT family N-acetyltransferase [Methylococcaceae bacterium]